jgi:hypothetical protein
MTLRPFVLLFSLLWPLSTLAGGYDADHTSETAAAQSAAAVANSAASAAQAAVRTLPQQAFSIANDFSELAAQGQAGQQAAVNNLGIRGLSNIWGGAQTFSSGVIYLNNLTLGLSMAAAANQAIINTAIQSLAGAGGTIVLPCGRIYVAAPIDNNVQNVLLKSCAPMQGWPFAGTSPGYVYSTEIVPTFSNGTVLKHRTPRVSTAPAFSGGGFDGLTVNGAGQGGNTLLSVDSVRRGAYHLTLLNGGGAQDAYFTSCVSGTHLASPCDVQFSDVDLEIQEPRGSATNGVVFTGSSNANFSFNHVRVRAQLGTGLISQWLNADNNTAEVSGWSESRQPGWLALMGCAKTSWTGGDHNIFTSLSGVNSSRTPPIYAQGANTAGCAAGVNNRIEKVDGSNDTLPPVAGTGSGWDYFMNNNPEWFWQNVAVSYQLKIPVRSASPAACDSSWQGGVYLNSASGQFGWCNGTAWASALAAQNNFSDVANPIAAYGNLRFQNTGTGATSLSPSARDKTTLNLIDYATNPVWGTGAVDDGPMIRAAAAECARLGYRKVYVPSPGTAYYLLSLDASGLGALVIGDGGHPNSCEFVGEAMDPTGAWTPGVNLKLGPSLNRPLVYVRSGAGSPIFRNFRFDANRGAQSGWSGGPSGALFAIEVEDGVASPEGSIQLYNSWVEGGLNGGLYIGSGRGATILENTWIIYNGQTTADVAVLLNGYDGAFRNIAVGSNAGQGILVNEGSQYQFSDGAIYMNGGDGMQINGAHVLYMTATGLNFQDNGCNGIDELNTTTPFPGQVAVGHMFSNITFDGNSHTTTGACSDVLAQNNLLSLSNPAFNGSGVGGNKPLYNIQIAGGGVSIGTPKFPSGMNSASVSGFTNDFDGIVTKQPGSLAVGNVDPPSGVLSSLVVGESRQYYGQGWHNGSMYFATIGGAASNNDNGVFKLLNGGTPGVQLVASGKNYVKNPISVGTTLSPSVPGANLNVVGGAQFNGPIYETSSNPPSSSSAACVTGQRAWDANWEYRCVATNTWRRTALSSW